MADSVSDAPRPPYSTGHADAAGRPPAPPVPHGPRGRGPAVVVELALPLAAPRVVGVLAVTRLRVGRVVGEPLAQLVAKGGLPLVEREVHQRSPRRVVAVPSSWGAAQVSRLSV